MCLLTRSLVSCVGLRPPDSLRATWRYVEGLSQRMQ